MAKQKISDDEFYARSADIAASAALGASQVYKKTMDIANTVVKMTTDNALARVTGVGYKLNSYNTMLRAFEKVEAQKIHDTIKDPNKSVKEKIMSATTEISKGTNKTALVAAGISVGKSTAVGAVAFGVGLIAGAMLPAASAAAISLATYKGGKMAVQYFLATPAGHKFEENTGKFIGDMPQKIEQGKKFVNGAFAVLTGKDKTYAQLAEIAETISPIMEKHHDHDQEHGHDDHGHHESFVTTVKKDVQNVIKQVRDPKLLFGHIIEKTAGTAMQLWEHIKPNTAAAFASNKAGMFDVEGASEQMALRMAQRTKNDNPHRKGM